MTIAVDHRSHRIGRSTAGSLARLLGIGYGVAVYAIFLATLLYAVGFVSGVVVPKQIDTGAIWPSSVALCIDLQLLGLFVAQHSAMARRGFKRVLTAHVPPLVERSTYVLCTSLVLIVLFAAWQPLPAVVWRAADPRAVAAIQALSAFGWLLVFGTFLSRHFEGFRRKRVVLNFAGRTASATQLRTPGLYHLIRHPLYLGFMLAFWSAPVMTAGHFLFAGVMTAYIFVGIWLEERDLLAFFGDQYRRYRQRVAMLLPGIF
ncbi:methanethiol S-methyltransferase [Bradyrhizobium sp. AZCC 2289]|uniref:methanethiol S-methyltransferase n=1 Tax=Bradyrhizobium sp. AZCC 2289 TaxID=3117026 RepID=UPI002FF1238C